MVSIKQSDRHFGKFIDELKNGWELPQSETAAQGNSDSPSPLACYHPVPLTAHQAPASHVDSLASNLGITSQAAVGFP